MGSDDTWISGMVQDNHPTAKKSELLHRQYPYFGFGCAVLWLSILFPMTWLLTFYVARMYPMVDLKTCTFNWIHCSVPFSYYILEESCSHAFILFFWFYHV